MMIAALGPMPGVQQVRKWTCPGQSVRSRDAKACEPFALHVVHFYFNRDADQVKKKLDEHSGTTSIKKPLHENR